MPVHSFAFAVATNTTETLTALVAEQARNTFGEVMVDLTLLDEQT